MKLIPIVNFDTSIKLLGNLTAMYRARVFKSNVSAQQTCVTALFSTIVTQSILFHSLDVDVRFHYEFALQFCYSLRNSISQ